MKLKDIRFNLRFSKGKSKNGEEQFDIIRSFQELKDNLNIDDLYLYFVSGQLARWLDCIGEQDKAKLVEKVDRKAPVKSQLEGIFGALDIDLSEKDLTSMVEYYTYFKQLEDRKREMVSILNNVQSTIEQNYKQYSQCLTDIIAAADDFTIVKTRVRALLKNFPQQFKLDWMRFYDIMMEKCPLAIFVILMDQDYRKYYLGTPEEMNSRYFFELDAPKEDGAGTTKQTAPMSQFISRVDVFLKVSYGSTNGLKIKLDDRINVDTESWKEKQIIKEVDYDKSGGEWEDAVDKGTKIMILHCGDSITIRPSGDKEHQSKGIQVRFPIFDGLDFRTSTSTPTSSDDLLLYMEIK